jgi:hypothetical protein
MKVSEYISGELAPFFTGTTFNADMLLLPSDLMSADYTTANETEVNTALIKAIARFMFRPRLEQINENGFSASFSYADLGKYYAYLCKLYGVEPDEDVLEESGLSTIVNISDEW